MKITKQSTTTYYSIETDEYNITAVLEENYDTDYFNFYICYIEDKDGVEIFSKEKVDNNYGVFNN